MATGFPVKPLELVDTAWLNAIGARKVGDVNIGGTAGTTFSSLPQTYKHLFLVWKGAPATSTGSPAAAVRVNTVSTANYFYQYVQAQAATPGSVEGVAAALGAVGFLPGSTGRGDAHYGASGVVLFPAYSLSSSFPTWVAVANYWLANSTGNGRSYHFGGALQNATGAITSIQILLSDGTNFATNSRATLYGLA